MQLTVEKLNEMFAEWKEKTSGSYEAMPWIECQDGEKLSVQVGDFIYCTPRSNVGPWFEVEVGFPTFDPPESWAEYMDGDWNHDDRKDTVYGYIPVELVVHTINEHGGMVE